MRTSNIQHRTSNVESGMGGGAICEALERRVMFADGGTILFVRGATRSGGFLEGTTADSRNEQLADINNASTSAGNAGWAALAGELRGQGFAVEQITEPKERTEDGSGVVAGRPIRFETMDLSNYSAIVFGSNNARYPKESVDAIESYIRGGGGALFISDANFGSNWRDAADSDQQFLARFGLIVNQDAASGTTTLSRGGEDFVAGDHPVLKGVDSITGEGVSPVVIAQTLPAGVTIARVVAATGQTRNNDGTSASNHFQGSLRPVTAQDAALALVKAGGGRVAAFFDRNTFFNANGVGTDITEADNRQLARNLFSWVSDSTPPGVVSSSFVQGAPSEARIRFNDSLAGSLTRGDVLLRDPFDATPVPRKRWSFSVMEIDGETELLIRIKGAQPAGTYQLQINPGRISDDAGNVNVRRVRLNFMIV
ncbi:MAG: hypothetical protein ABIP55_02935 [Tepidisphaeraceae bacterium]